MTGDSELARTGRTACAPAPAPRVVARRSRTRSRCSPLRSRRLADRAVIDFALRAADEVIQLAGAIVGFDLPVPCVVVPRLQPSSQCGALVRRELLNLQLKRVERHGLNCSIPSYSGGRQVSAQHCADLQRPTE